MGRQTSLVYPIINLTHIPIDIISTGTESNIDGGSHISVVELTPQSMLPLFTQRALTLVRAPSPPLRIFEERCLKSAGHTSPPSLPTRTVVGSLSREEEVFRMGSFGVWSRWGTATGCVVGAECMWVRTGCARDGFVNLRSAFLALGFSGWSVSGASNRSAIHRCNSQHNIIIIIYIYYYCSCI